jgi:hypothetical protein
MVTIVLEHLCELIARDLAARLTHGNHEGRTAADASCLRKQDDGSGPIERSWFVTVRAFDHMLDGGEIDEGEIDELAFRHSPLFKKSTDMQRRIGRLTETGLSGKYWSEIIPDLEVCQSAGKQLGVRWRAQPLFCVVILFPGSTLRPDAA